MNALRLAFVLFAFVSCAREVPPSSEGSFVPPPGEESSLLLVTLDTFRADAAGCGGSPRGRTPHLDRLARTGVQFETGLAGSPLTLPSHTCMLTGRNVPSHGVRDNGTFRLDETIPTFPEQLHDAGFATGAFIGAFPLDRRFGLARGFSHYDDEVGSPGGPGGLAMAERAGERVVAATRTWLAGIAVGQRWFAWVHLFDAHIPHNPPRPLIRGCADDPYLADVAWADRFLGEAVRAAREAPGNPWIVVLGDHGESRGDHGEATHGLFVYDATIRIPAVIAPAPSGRAPGLVREVFRTIDLPATALDLLGMTHLPPPGTGLKALLEGDRPAYVESRFGRYHYGWASLHALQLDTWKFVLAPEPELYDLSSDPGETRNVVGEFPQRAAELREALKEILRAEQKERRVPLDPAAQEALQSLGYVTQTAEETEEFPDPKRMIVIQQLLETAQGFISQGSWDAALAPLRAALSRDPRNKDIHQTLGLAQSALGRHELAVDSFQRCLELPPHENDRVPRFELATAYLRLGKSKEALEHLRILVANDPKDAPTWYNLGVAWSLQGETGHAESAWERALEVDPQYELALRSLGRSAPSPQP